MEHMTAIELFERLMGPVRFREQRLRWCQLAGIPPTLK